MHIMLLQKPKEIVPMTAFLKKLHQSTKNLSISLLYLSISLSRYLYTKITVVSKRTCTIELILCKPSNDVFFHLRFSAQSKSIMKIFKCFTGNYITILLLSNLNMCTT